MLAREHGAGRAMSRGAAKKAITPAQRAEAMKEGIEGRLGGQTKLPA
jgi:RNA-splicing ligase RtcB